MRVLAGTEALIDYVYVSKGAAFGSSELFSMFSVGGRVGAIPTYSINSLILVQIIDIQVYYRLMGDAVRVDCEGMGAKMVKLPKLDKIMKDDQFQEILLQDVEGLGEDGKTSWILILGSAVSYSISVTVSQTYAC